jgi:hypothetical protein
MSNKRRPILYRGETLATLIKKSGNPFDKQPGITFDEARENIILDLEETEEKIEQLQFRSKLPNETIVCVKMHSDYSAKSYYPESIFNTVSGDFSEIGSRLWREKSHIKKLTKSGKMFFVRINKNSIKNFRKRLVDCTPTNEKQKKFVLDIRRLSGIGLLDPTDQVLGFSDDWQSGMMEAVIHPFSTDREIVVSHFMEVLRNAGLEEKHIKYKQYKSGVTFVSIKGNRNVLQALSGYNPLRTIHPLNSRDLIDITRGNSVSGSPLPPVFKEKSKIVVGILDGGFNVSNSFLSKYVDSEDSVSGKAFQIGIDHGTMVTGAALYGPLNAFKNNVPLPEPVISAKNFRVIAEDSFHMHEMYDSIDAIEKIVPNNPEIKVYNVSFGPNHPILDDYLNRFTYSLDGLSEKHKVLFCVAVGNDGDEPGYDRIQSPSDMVNGLAIGSYRLFNGKKERADYSCVGPGREGSKLKPDLLAFGGCEQNPMHLFSPDPTSRFYDCGTSYSSPIVAGAAAQLIGGSKNVIDSLIAKALIIHTTEQRKEKHCKEIGHGMLPDDLANIVSCHDKSFTLIYNGEINPKSYARFEIPWVKGITGNVKFSWTLNILTAVNENSPDDYTNTTIEMAFYPNSKRYKFKKPDNLRDPKVKEYIELNIEGDAERIKDLIEAGWKRGAYPVTSSNSSSSPAKFLKESDLRADLKWDTSDHRTNVKRASGIDNPFFIIHAMSRGKNADKEKVRYALILTVEALNAKEDIYDKVLNKYTALAPVSVEIKTNVVVTTPTK